MIPDEPMIFPERLLCGDVEVRLGLGGQIIGFVLMRVYWVGGRTRERQLLWNPTMGHLMDKAFPANRQWVS